MTNHWIDIKNSDVILIMGSNAAENHPISFKWVPEARDKGATLISVDPRFTRTSAKANIYAPIRSGADIPFLGGMINYILQNELYHRKYVQLYTNATFILNDAFDTENEFAGVEIGLIWERYRGPWSMEAYVSSTTERGAWSGGWPRRPGSKARSSRAILIRSRHKSSSSSLTSVPQ